MPEFLAEMRQLLERLPTQIAHAALLLLVAGLLLLMAFTP